VVVFSFVEFETAADLRTAVEKLDNREFKGQRVSCVADVCFPQSLVIMAAEITMTVLTNHPRLNPVCLPGSAVDHDRLVGGPMVAPLLSLTIDVVLLDVGTAPVHTMRITDSEAPAVTITTSLRTDRLRAVARLLTTICHHVDDTMIHTGETTVLRRIRMWMVAHTAALPGSFLPERAAMGLVKAVATLVRSIAEVVVDTGKLLHFYRLESDPLLYLDAGSRFQLSPLRWPYQRNGGSPRGDGIRNFNAF
jgi:hypothetical protein